MSARTVPTMPDWTSHEVATSALLEQITTYTRFWADPPMFRMKQTIAQSVPNDGAFHQITCETPDYDTDNGRSLISPYSYTIPVGMTGRWKFWIKDSFVANTTGVRVVQLYRNGAGVPEIQKFDPAGSSFGMQAAISDEIAVSAGDVMSMWAFQNSGGALNTDTSSPPVFGGRLVSLANP